MHLQFYFSVRLSARKSVVTYIQLVPSGINVDLLELN